MPGKQSNADKRRKKEEKERAQKEENEKLRQAHAALEGFFESRGMNYDGNNLTELLQTLATTIDDHRAELAETAATIETLKAAANEQKEKYNDRILLSRVERKRLWKYSLHMVHLLLKAAGPLVRMFLETALNLEINGRVIPMWECGFSQRDKVRLNEALAQRMLDKLLVVCNDELEELKRQHKEKKRAEKVKEGEGKAIGGSVEPLSDEELLEDFVPPIKFTLPGMRCLYDHTYYRTLTTRTHTLEFSDNLAVEAVESVSKHEDEPQSTVLPDLVQAYAPEHGFWTDRMLAKKEQPPYQKFLARDDELSKEITDVEKNISAIIENLDAHQNSFAALADTITSVHESVVSSIEQQEKDRKAMKDKVKEGKPLKDILNLKKAEEKGESSTTAQPDKETTSPATAPAPAPVPASASAPAPAPTPSSSSSPPETPLPPPHIPPLPPLQNIPGAAALRSARSYWDYLTSGNQS
ncbi:hypothetical protein BJ508DRAFT_325922 [Ascobolus immersus RN42]|uniref:Uncharacterized protein n=1 Tax=Ascobolus immersus RN42 TaxID=1160509 RepID=A0A3N4I745_ASCIM|nr:hypothetical protein BJ508DRAFT_325922 [Ascobolus immersus RN42]